EGEAGLASELVRQPFLERPSLRVDHIPDPALSGFLRRLSRLLGRTAEQRRFREERLRGLGLEPRGGDGAGRGAGDEGLLPGRRGLEPGGLSGRRGSRSLTDGWGRYLYPRECPDGRRTGWRGLQGRCWRLPGTRNDRPAAEGPPCGRRQYQFGGTGAEWP